MLNNTDPTSLNPECGGKMNFKPSTPIKSGVFFLSPHQLRY